MQPLPNASKAYGMLRQEEKQRETTTSKYMTPAIMSTYSNPNQHQHPQASYRQNRTSSSNSNYRNDYNQRRSAFRQGVYCGNCQKEGHYKCECYQLVGYPIGHPLHGKVKPVNKGADSKPRVVNISVRLDGASTSGKELNNDDATVFAKMVNLQNQLKQVMMMLQNSQGVCDPKIMAAGRYFFIASIISHFKDAWGNNQKIAHGIQSDGLYIITPDSTPSSPSPTTPFVNTICKDIHLWHLRLDPISSPIFFPQPVPSPTIIPPSPTSPAYSDPSTHSENPTTFTPPSTLDQPIPNNTLIIQPNTNIPPISPPTSETPPIPPLSLEHPSTTTPTTTQTTEPPLTETSQTTLPGTSTRTKTLPIKLKDYHYYKPSHQVNSILSKHHISHFINYSNITKPATLHLINSLNQETEPTSYTQASKHPKWVEAMHKKIDALEANNTWEITTLPPFKTPIGYKWVFRIKYNADGTVEMYKARLVAKGHTQKEGIDYTETFAPVAKMVTVRTIFVLASTSNWHIHKLDINNAFLHDDILITSNSLSFMNHIKDKLHKEFSIKDLGQLSYYLGIEFLRSSKGIVMTQRKYALDLIEQAGLTNTKHAKTPLDPNVKLTFEAGDLLPDPSIYKALARKLIYLTISRPDVAFASQVLSQFSHNPYTTHMEALKRVITYIKLSPGQGIFFPRHNPLILQAYCHSDWASC
ncbi:uncharacterized mitochondrial protein-like protein [Tanacetum coccineum]